MQEQSLESVGHLVYHLVSNMKDILGDGNILKLLWWYVGRYLGYIWFIFRPYFGPVFLGAFILGTPKSFLRPPHCTVIPEALLLCPLPPASLENLQGCAPGAEPGGIGRNRDGIDPR